MQVIIGKTEKLFFEVETDLSASTKSIYTSDRKQMIFLTSAHGETKNLLVSNDPETLLVLIKGKETEALTIDGHLNILSINEFKDGLNNMGEGYSYLEESIVIPDFIGEIRAGVMNFNFDLVTDFSTNNYIKNDVDDVFVVFIDLPKGTKVIPWKLFDQSLLNL